MSQTCSLPTWRLGLGTFPKRDIFLNKRKSKLDSRGDRPFQVLKRINDNAYKINLLGEYNISATFNVTNLSPFDFHVRSDSRMNHLKEEGDEKLKELIQFKFQLGQELISSCVGICQGHFGPSSILICKC
ncbi:hypothetical protein ACH5RR_001147 [Cinchona calisaya]|uniref:Tf2-1-like SH3-like domain-containing protein n=1 Tax=Cinchona calisaya TaxID=153742 RepID=A0ABD3B2V4_9GENT